MQIARVAAPELVTRHIKKSPELKCFRQNRRDSRPCGHVHPAIFWPRLRRDSRVFVIPPNSNTISDWRRTCHVSLVKTSWRPRANKTSWRPRATTTWTFDSHVIRSCTFETAANLYASRRQANNFYLCIVLFWVGRYNKTLNDWPLGKQWVLFSLDSMFPSASPRGTLRVSGKQNSLFPLGPVIKCLLSNEIKGGNGAQVSWIVRFARLSICLQTP